MITPRQDFPICLASSGTVAVGAVFTPNADDLQNHFDTPIQIEEIRFMFFVNGASANPPASLAALIRVQIKMGRIDLTNGFIPSWLLGSRLQWDAEFLNGVAGGGRLAAWDCQRWRLPVPMIVPSGSTLMPLFQYLLPDGTQGLTSANNSPITVYVAMIGKSLNRNPVRKIRVPYATAFIANPATQGQQSMDDQLVNKFNTPLWVQRFVGRIAKKGGANEAWISVEDATTFAAVGNMSMVDSNGYSIVDDAQWFDVFSRSRKILPVGCFLRPRGWYTVKLADKPSSAYLPMVSMIGWREEELIP